MLSGVADDGDMGSTNGKDDESNGSRSTCFKEKILEINGNHAIFKNINSIYEKDSKSPDIDEWVKLLYDQALIAEGQSIENPTEYFKRVNNLLD